MHLNILNGRFKKLKLILLGDFEEYLNPLKRETIDTIKSCEKIIQVGFQSDIREYLAISSILILPSYREGLPNSLLEAGCFGLPLIASDINGCNEVVDRWREWATG